MSYFKKNKKGALLLFLLGMIAALSTVVAAIIFYASRIMASKASDMLESPLRAEAYSALYAAVAELEELYSIDGGFYSEAQGWGECFKSGRVALPGGSDVEVKVSDMQGKISISGISISDYKKILEELGFTELEAAVLGDCYFDWIDSDNAVSGEGAEMDDYPDGAPKPPNRPLESFGEFRRIKGYAEIMFNPDSTPTELYQTFTRIFSLETFSGVNLNSASSEVLELLCNISEVDFDPLMHDAVRGEGVPLSDGISWVKNAGELRERGCEPPARNAEYKTGMIKIEVRAKRGAAEFFLSAIYSNSLSEPAPADKTAIGRPEQTFETASGFKLVRILERQEPN
ncbi:MAG: general secretion pathway protein GspK [Opitutales bacterium]|nr:general secretion pathway protein GspK [Opitutales bacterium]